MKKIIRFEDSYSVDELWILNGRRFPFWIKPWLLAQSCMKVTGFDDGFDDGFRNLRAFVGQRYALDRKTLLASRIIVPIDNQRGWILG